MKIVQMNLEQLEDEMSRKVVSVTVFKGFLLMVIFKGASTSLNYQIIELTERRTNAVGFNISTKAEGRDNFARKDLTDQYKFR